MIIAAGDRAGLGRCSRRARLVGALLVALAAATFLVDAAPRVTAPFGDSHDGMNGAMWASGARSLADDGPVDSRLGAAAPERITYAHHPPGIYLVTAAARAIGGDREVALRAPAYLSSVLAIGLTWLLLRRLRFSLAAAAMGIAALAGSDMFLVFGAMPNFEALSLPLALGTLLVHLRVGDGVSDRPALVFALGAAAALTSWEGIVLIGAVVGADAWRRRRDPDRPATARWLAAGALSGLAVTVLWLWWANRSWSELWTVLRARSGDDGAGLVEYADRQSLYFRMGFPVWALLLSAAGVVAWAVLRRGQRVEPLLLLGVPLVYALAFRQGSYIHAYWNFWLLLPVAVFAAMAVDALALERARRQAPLAVLAAALLLLGPSLGRSPQRQTFEAGADAGALVAEHLRDAGPVAVWPGVGEPAWWLDYYGRAPHDTLVASELRSVADERPGRLVLVGRVAVEHHFTAELFARLEPLAEHQQGDYLLIEAGSLAPAVDTVTAARAAPVER